MKKVVALITAVQAFAYERLLAYAAALAMFAMMLVTLIDVVGRYLFSSPLAGGFEITEFLLAGLIFLGLPMVTAANEHVDVDLMDSSVPQFLKPAQNFIICLLNLLAFSVLSWMLWQLAIRTYRYQDTTAILEIPFTGLVVLMAMCSSFAAVSLLLMLCINGGQRPLLSKKQ